MGIAKDKGLEKVTIRLFEGDKDKLSAIFHPLKYNKTIRYLVRNLIKSIEEKAAQKAKGINQSSPTIEVDLDLVQAEAAEGGE